MCIYQTHSNHIILGDPSQVPPDSWAVCSGLSFVYTPGCWARSLSNMNPADYIPIFYHESEAGILLLGNLIEHEL